jgi:DNA repair protein RadC
MSAGRKSAKGAAGRTAESNHGALFGAPDPDPKAAPAPGYIDHRARLRARFATGGAEALADYELLELVLFRLIPRRDTKPLAKALLARFGDLAGVLGAPAPRIAEVDGAGPAVAADLKALQARFERTSRADIGKRDVLATWTALAS